MKDKTLYIFNPENDMALAQGGKYYVAPPLPRTLASDLSLLPLWYGMPDAVVLSSSSVSPLWQEQLRNVLGIGAVWQYIKNGQQVSDFFPQMKTCCPWGWSFSIKTRLLSMGVSPDVLPDDTQIEILRQLSHRAITRQIIDQLHQRDICPEIEKPQQLYTISAVKDFVEKHRYTVLKAPWSSSGKGICWCRNSFDKIVENWSCGILSRQKSVIAECYYSKQIDFAMEFHRKGKEISFAGYSCFNTDSRGAYHGNWLASDQTIELYLSSYVGIRPMLLLKSEMCHILEMLLVNSEYEGYLGVDMMIYKNEADDSYLIHPCVELNLRMSMGMVARILFDRYIDAGSQGYFYVDFCKEEGLQLDFHQKNLSEMPLRMNSGKIEKGYWPLSPVFGHTCFRAYAQIFNETKPMPFRFLQSD